jgi:hypothetical protein
MSNVRIQIWRLIFKLNIYTVRSINFRTDFFKITEVELSIGQKTKYVLSTNVRSHTEFRLFIFDSVRVITCLVKSLFFIRHGWRELTESCYNILFKAGLSATETLVLVQKDYGNEALNRSKVFKRYSWFRGGRELVEDEERSGCPKSTRTEVKNDAVADFVKNDHRIESRMIP